MLLTHISGRSSRVSKMRVGVENAMQNIVVNEDKELKILEKDSIKSKVANNEQWSTIFCIHTTAMIYHVRCCFVHFQSQETADSTTDTEPEKVAVVVFYTALKNSRQSSWLEATAQQLPRTFPCTGAVTVTLPKLWPNLCWTEFVLRTQEPCV